MLREPTQIAAWYVGACVVLLPVQRFSLPFNMTFVDALGVAVVPVALAVAMVSPQQLRLPYGLPWTLYVLGGIVGSLNAVDAVRSGVEIGRDLYVYAWFLVLLGCLTAVGRLRYAYLMRLWAVVTCVHGGFIILQFASPELLQATTAWVGTFTGDGSHRPLGLFQNPNKAAAFQSIGIVPVLYGLREWVWRSLALLVVAASIMATGSMGALLAFMCGLLVLGLTGSFDVGRVHPAVVWRRQRAAAVLAVGLVVVAGAAAAFMPETLAAVQRMTVERLDRSAGNRFTMWSDALGVADDVGFYGIGPAQFRDARGATMHNDALTALVERGILGLIGFTFFGLAIVAHALVRSRVREGRPFDPLSVRVTIATAVLIGVLSLTHQVVHFNFFWFALAANATALSYRV